MGFNLLGAVAGAAQGAAMGGNPLTIGAGALTGAFASDAASTAGGFSNSAQNLVNGGYLARPRRSTRSRWSSSSNCRARRSSSTR